MLSRQTMKCLLLALMHFWVFKICIVRSFSKNLMFFVYWSLSTNYATWTLLFYKLRILTLLKHVLLLKRRKKTNNWKRQDMKCEHILLLCIFMRNLFSFGHKLNKRYCIKTFFIINNQIKCILIQLCFSILVLYCEQLVIKWFRS